MENPLITKGRFQILAIVLVISLLSNYSCVPSSKLKYLNDIDEITEPVVNPVKSKKINPFDRIIITVLSTDQQTADLLNYSASKNPDNSLKGYIVDEEGNINFPFVGKIKVTGLTLAEAKDKIVSSISSIIKDPEVVVVFENNKFTILGEVVNQGSFPIDEEFITIYESLAKGGGLTQFADRKKVILLRNENNKLIYYKLDLSNSKIASSSHYYIFPDDIIIIEPLKQKSFSTQNQVFSNLTSAISVVISFISIYQINQVRLEN